MLTTFSFSHRALTLEDSFFAKGSDGYISLYVNLGDVRGSIRVESLADTFSIPADCDDGQLLRMVPKALNFVRSIRCGDAIPTELIDGKASWKPADCHRQTAEAKFGAGLIAAITGIKPGSLEALKLEADLETRRRIKESTADLARHCGLPPDRKEEVLQRMERLIDELAMIEALRDFFSVILDIRRHLAGQMKKVAREAESVQEVRRVDELAKVPLAALRTAFDQTDAMIGEALSTMRNFDASLKVLQARRNELHSLSMEWSELRTIWAQVADDPRDMQYAVKQLYRFLAQRHLRQRVW